jgi:glycosyltransferase involved in cell wall biosynthesis
MNDKDNNSKDISTIFDLRGENSKIFALLATLVDELERAENKSISLQSSLCWKMTAPFRLADEILFQKARNKIFRYAKTEKNNACGNKIIEQARALVSSRNRIAYNPEVVCFDVSVLANNDAGTGIQRVVREIATNIVDQNNPNYKLVDFSGPEPIDVTNKFRSEKFSKNDIEFINEIGHIVFLDSSWFLFNKGLDFYLKARDKGVKITTVIYDIFPLTNPEFCEVNTVQLYKSWFSNILSITDGFLSISKATSESLKSFINLTSHIPETIYKYDFWHLGSDIKSPKEYRDPIYEDKFMLMVSTVEPRKNYEFVVDEVTKMWKSMNLNHRLVIVGRPGWNYDHVHKKIKSHPEFGRKLIWHSDGISDELLNSLYNKCSVLIQASLNEGFGLAVVEASSFNKPIILSDIPVFREIVINNGYFFELGSGSSFVKALHAAVSSDALATNTIQKSWFDSTNDFVRKLNPDYAKEG